MTPFLVERTRHRLSPDPRRVIAKPYLPGEEIVPGGDSRSGLLMRRVLAIPEDRVPGLLDEVLTRFSRRHANFERLLEHHFELVAHHIPPAIPPLTRERRWLIGAYYTNEYSIEAAALCNPSLVAAPDQSGVAPGQLRFIMSVRAIGEGHISSIGLRTGVLGPTGEPVFDGVGACPATGARTSPERYDRRSFTLKLGELGAGNDLAWLVMDRLPERFSLAELEHSLAQLEQEGPPHAITFETAKIIRLLAASSYVTTFSDSTKVSERVLFPAGPHETRGMEDARFVRFVDDDGSARYYATYTAYDGFQILPQLIETQDFRAFNINTLNGPAAQNKGMALFPRKLGGRFVMLSRKDRENLHLSVSDDVHTWTEVTELDRPREPWQLLQIGNCGSPIETDAGWLVITHGVGAMRRYALGAMLLDLEDPSRVIGRLPYPLLEPRENEREGYVPNVLYSCGALPHAGSLVLPYGISDGAIGVALVPLAALLAELTRNAC